MASPMPMAPMGSWGGQDQQQQQQQQQIRNSPAPAPPAPTEMEETGMQVRLMGLKVTYTVDREAQVNYLARHPQPLHVQTITMDERNTIGIVDLKECAQCVVSCSPELASQDCDYTVYAYDFSEPDTPLVGQGLLSWIVDAEPAEAKIVIGRVTKNMLAAFAGGIKETLEVKFKLMPTPRINRQEPRNDFRRAGSHLSIDAPPPSQNRPQESVMTPTGAAEWNAFIQSNPQLGHTAHGSRVASPAPSQHQAAAFSNPPYQHRRDSYSHPAASHHILPQTSQSFEGLHRIAPTPVDAPTESGADPASRPSSRASTKSRKRAPTGRPRGRPRKKPALENQGSTSGYEEGTDAEEGPAKKKRIMTTQVTRYINAPFGGGADSLRVAASTAGSIRTLRPAASASEMGRGNHLQEVPRAPTPVPDGGPLRGPAGRPLASKLRRESTLSQAATLADQGSFNDLSFGMSPPSQDGRSPGDSEVVTPMYSDESPVPIGSSPPVPRAVPYMQSSPPASSPILPPMPMPKPQPDSGFMSGGGMEDSFEEPTKAFQLPPPGAVIRPKPRPRDTSNIPIQVFDMQLQALSSDVDMLPFHKNSFGPSHASRSASHTPALPSLKRSRSNSGANRPIPSLQPDDSALTTRRTGTPSEIGTPLEDPSIRAAELLKQAAHERNQQSDLPNPIPQAGQEEARPSATVRSQSQDVSATFVQPPPPQRQLARSASVHTMSLALPTIAASDPIGPLALRSQPSFEATSFSEAPCPPSDALQAPRSPSGSKSNKNLVKKESIRQRLEQAIASGEMPPYCNNCGAIETPTWRKIWTQEHDGVPEFYEFSEKPGKVTACIVLERDDDEKITKYQLIKKGLAPKEDKSDWTQLLLCNPCGIWLSKWKSHRPREKWDKDLERLQQTRGRKGAGRSSKSRSKKGSAQKGNPTSDAYFQTDPMGPDNADVSPEDYEMQQFGLLPYDGTAESRSREASLALEQALANDSQPPSREHRSNPGSTHSRGSGTVNSPIALDMGDDVEAMGTTRRLLFPSPRKDGNPKSLSDIAVNIVQTPPRQRGIKEVEADKENIPVLNGQDDHLGVDDDDLEALFRSPMARPSTPPPKDKGLIQGPFKTPTRPTPSHRPVTRSITRSIRSARSVRSLERTAAMLQQTPSRTPRTVARFALLPESPTVRRSPRFASQHGDEEDHHASIFETPMTRSLNQLLSEAQDFDMDSVHLDIDLSALPCLDELTGHEGVTIDFGSLLSTDAVMPSSPPKMSRQSTFESVDAASMWAQWDDGNMDVELEE